MSDPRAVASLAALQALYALRCEPAANTMTDRVDTDNSWRIRGTQS